MSKKDIDRVHGEESEDKCEHCDGNMTWCETCKQWSRTCCKDYGSCMCS